MEVVDPPVLLRLQGGADHLQACSPIVVLDHARTREEWPCLPQLVCPEGHLLSVLSKPLLCSCRRILQCLCIRLLIHHVAEVFFICIVEISLIFGNVHPLDENALAALDFVSERVCRSLGVPCVQVVQRFPLALSK